jgi:uncharacterized protein (DUF952 family)
MIFHITRRIDWLAHGKEKAFVAADFKREGFIHCCTKEQIAGVIERYFKNQSDLLLLHMDENKLAPELKYEPSTNNEKFPHVYGPINKEAVVEVSAL